MAAAHRCYYSRRPPIVTFFRLFLLFQYFVLSQASPTSPSLATLTLLPRSTPIIRNTTGTPIVFNPDTQQSIPQSPASDGAGKNFSPPALLWIGFCFLVGPPLALAGIRGWRFTTGAGVGLAAAVCSWAAVITSVSSVGVSDIFLSIIVFAFFSAGFIFGLFNVGRTAGVILLAITGGFAFGIRIVILTAGLLVSESSLFFINWLIAAMFGAGGGLLLLYSARVGITVGSASAGTFLSLLGVDLILNKQAGMSRGLRFLFDRNSSHFLDIAQNGYKPPLSATIIIGVSLALTPILAYLQHRIFPHPFYRGPPPDTELDPVNADIVSEKRFTIFNTIKGRSRFSM